jgi:ribonuclease E
VVRRLVECLGRDRTKHQVAEVTSLGLVQMTRKRVGQGLLESFSETCEACNGRGVKVHLDPVDPKPGRERDRDPKVGPRAPKPGAQDDEAPSEGSGGSRNRRRRGGSRGTGAPGVPPETELAELLAESPAPDAAEQQAEVVPQLDAEADLAAVPAEADAADAVEQAEEVVLEPDASPIPPDDAPLEEASIAVEPALTDTTTDAPPAKKRRRAASRPAGSPDV